MAAAGAKAGNKNRELIRAQKATYEVTKPLATGTFGSIYRAKREPDGKLFAVKCESLKMKHSLLRQASIVLASMSYPSKFFVSIEERGTVPSRFLFVVMPLYGENLSDLMLKSTQNKKFSMSSGLHLAGQTLEAIRDLHRNGFVHRDIKPGHFCIGREEDDTYHNVYMIDFGLCKRPPKFSKKGDEADEKLKKGAILYRGVVRYASLNAHAGKDLGFRDDMESWWYMVLEFFLGGVPWAYLNKQNEKDVVHMKSTLNEQMIGPAWKVKPDVISTFFEILSVIRSVTDINEYVDYNRINESLKSMFEKSGANIAEPPDWDCMTDYKGPAYQEVIMMGIQPEAVALKDAEFGKTDADGLANADKGTGVVEGSGAMDKGDAATVGGGGGAARKKGASTMAPPTKQTSLMGTPKEEAKKKSKTGGPKKSGKKKGKKTISEDAAP